MRHSMYVLRQAVCLGKRSLFTNGGSRCAIHNLHSSSLSFLTFPCLNAVVVCFLLSDTVQLDDDGCVVDRKEIKKGSVAWIFSVCCCRHDAVDVNRVGVWYDSLNL